MSLRPFALVCFCALLAAGCGNHPTTPDETTPGWSWLNPVTGGADLHDVQAVATDRAVAVGSGGTILLYADGFCREMPSGVRADLHAIRRTGDGDFVVVGAAGTVLAGDGATWSPRPGPGPDTALRDVLIHADGTLHVAGFAAREPAGPAPGAIVPYAVALAFDGVAWRSLAAPELVGTFTALAGPAPDDVHFGYSTEPAYHYGPRGWTAFSMGVNDDGFGTSVAGLCALDSGHVFAAGSGGQVRRFDGTQWTALNLDDRTSLNGIWAAGPDSVWVVGGRETGVVARHGAGGWRQTNRVGTHALHAVHGAPDGGLFAVGAGGAFLRRMGERWRPVNGFTANALTCIWGPADDDLYFGGDDGIFHFDGRTFTSVPCGLIFVRDIWGTGPDDIYVAGTPVGPAASGLVHFDGTGWRPAVFAEDLFVRFDAVAGDGRGTVFATVGNRIYRQRDGVWTLDFSVELPVWWSALRVFPDGRAVAVGGRGILATYDGSRWELQETGTTSDLTCLWAAGPDRIFVGTADGAILDSSRAWAAAAQFSVYRIEALWGRAPDVIVAAGGGRLLRFDGDQWSEPDSGPPVAVRAGWPVADGSVLVVGAGGAVLRGWVAR